MFNQTFVNIKLYGIYRTLKKDVLKKFDQFFDMNDKRKNFVLLQILNQIQQDNADVRDGLNKYVPTKGISFEQVFYILLSDVVFIVNKSPFSLYFDQ